MTKVGLDRPQSTTATRIRIVPKHPLQRFELGSIGQHRTVRRRFQVADRAWIELSQCVAKQRLLPLHIREPRASRPPVVVDRTTADQGVNRVPVGQRLLGILEHEDPDTFSGHITRARVRERRAVLVRRQDLHLGQQRVVGRMEVEIDPPRQREVPLAAANVSTGLVNRDQRGRAVTVERQARALKIQEVRDPTDHRGQGRGLKPSGSSRGVKVEPLLGDPSEHPGPRPLRGRQTRRGKPGILERAPALLQKQPLLGVDERRLSGRDAEEQRIERREVVEKSAPLSVGLAVGHRSQRVGFEMRVPVPPRRGHGGDRRLLGREQVPKTLGRRRAGKSSRDSDDRHVASILAGARRLRRPVHEVRSPWDRLVPIHRDQRIDEGSTDLDPGQLQGHGESHAAMQRGLA